MTESVGDRLRRLGALTGEPVDELHRWVSRGLFADAAAGVATDVARVRLVQVLRRHGFDADAVLQAADVQPDLFDRYVHQVVRPTGELHQLAEVAGSLGLDRATVRRLWDASGLSDQGEIGTDDDVDALRAVAVALDAGLPEDALVQLLRVYADALGRVAEAETRLFHVHVHERLRTEGASATELVAGTDAALAQLEPLAEPTLAYFHRKALARAVGEDIALHLAEEAGLLPAGDATGSLSLSVAFVDLVRFSTMTEAMGDLAAVHVLDRFSELTRRCVVKAGGRVVKQIGDEFMLVFPDAAAAVDAAIGICDEATRQPAFLATRLGVHSGTVLCREGDYIGRTVNIAARITAQAAPHQLLVSQQARADVAARRPGVVFRSVGRPDMKGVAEPMELFEVVAPERALADGRAVDPVCGMSVDPRAAGAHGEYRGTEYVFCSERCAGRFSDDPDRYG